MFTCYPKYNINLGDKDFDNSLSLYFKFLRNDFMKKGNNVMTMYCSVSLIHHLLKLVMNVKKLLK